MIARFAPAADRAGFPLMGSSAAPLADAGDTGGAWEAMEISLGAEGRSPLHTVLADKMFYVVAGTVTITLGDDEREVIAGGGAFVPAGTPHRYRNASGTPATLLVVTSGSGHVDFLRGMSSLTAAGTPDPDALARHTQAHGVRLL